MSFMPIKNSSITMLATPWTHLSAITFLEKSTFSFVFSHLKKLEISKDMNEKRQSSGAYYNIPTGPTTQIFNPNKGVSTPMYR